MRHMGNIYVRIFRETHTPGGVRRMTTTYKAYLLVREIATREVVHRVGVSNLSENYVDRVVRGMLINMDRERFIVDENEVDAAREGDKS